ncbi:hypothetical protein L1049_020817 [Liquidambar formosana]|uniref:Protein kinase domain-containing protein n=1 Tax=Liquidambar formosana TaxID=63359 RepID=A0AAP0X7R7_LIQFO
MKMSLVASVLYFHFVILSEAFGHTADLEDNTTIVYTPPFHATHVRVGEAHSKPFWGYTAVPSGFLVLLVGVGVAIPVFSWAIYHFVKRQRRKRLRRRFFIQNGGDLLSSPSSRSTVGDQRIRLFEEEEIQAATADYSSDRIIGQGGEGLVFKAMLKNGTVVAIKKALKVNKVSRECFINEIVILSNVEHRNIVRLFGFCLETDHPFLIYEYIPNGDLYDLFHVRREEYLNSWEVRQTILREVGEALKKLHSIPSQDSDGVVLHRDVKLANILMDVNHRTVLADFGFARILGMGDNHVTMPRPFGSVGYMDPQMLQSGRYTEQSDIYSLGIVMAELITGERASTDAHGSLGLGHYFARCVGKRRLFNLIDPRIRTNDNADEIQWFAEVAAACLRQKWLDRPNMVQVVKAMEGDRTPI